MGSATDAELGFFDALNSDEYLYLGATFYTAVGVVATLVIIIIIMAIGYCCFARYLVKRNRLMNRKVKLLTSPQENNDDIIELKVNNTTLKPGSVEEDNVNEQQTKRQLQLSQENVATEMSSQDNLRDTIPLIQEKVDEIPNENKTIDPKQVKNIPEGMYATVNNDDKTENGVAHNMTVTADVMPPMVHGFTVNDGDYAEVKCDLSTSYPYPPGDSAKDRSRTLPSTAMVDIDMENEDYSRLVHDTQKNPRHSMPLLSDYSRIGVGGAKWRSLETELDQNQNQNQNEDLYATPNPKTRSNHDIMNSAAYCDTPSPLPTPVIDDPDKILGTPGSQESRPSSQKQGKESDKEMTLDTSAPPKGESPPPLPPPYLDGDLEEASEALYDEAIIVNHYQNVSSRIESGDGNVDRDGKGGFSGYSKLVDINVAKENAGLMNTGDLQEGIYDSIDQEGD